ncbi:AraC-like DNA-binding protein [Paenibacillus forsythiae]|uniref:AraC-like DNA-binding protein n=1 Tax=Paenibacillus forsythiae TaxID=365616 RepID=A0ABU3H7Y7_9BACL|nr:helix-turn-helix domain-containing protein [Paenibacillus forsythiae]MDT3425805.1 AraC-like DNA-binding protein [Paenibacillus forsythiae]
MGKLSTCTFVPVQIGFEMDTEYYIEKSVNYCSKLNHSVLYFQFKMNRDSDIIRVLPDGCVDILFGCDPLRPYSHVCGSVLQTRQIHFQAGTTYFGVRFLPESGINRILSLKEALETEIPLMDLVKGKLGIYEDILRHDQFQLRIHYFEKYLLGTLLDVYQSPNLIDYCINQIYHSKGNITINQLADATGYSTRYIRIKFEDTLGISPKLFSQIVRFQQSLIMMLKHNIEPFEVIDEQGYYDQSHLIKEFKKFSKYTPLEIKAKWDHFVLDSERMTVSV